jgi:hypothetical protein
MAQFLEGETSERPFVPQHYFDRATENRLNELVGRGESSLSHYHEVVLGALPRQIWRPNTVRLIANWLMLVAAAKARRAASKAVVTRRRAS